MKHMIVAAALLLATPVLAEEAAPKDLIAVERVGDPDGRTLVLIPGLASSADVWDGTVEALKGDYDLRVVQAAGFAGAPPVAVDGPFADAFAAAVAGHLEAEPGRDVILVGHSLGGFVSLKTALAAPDLVNEMVIVDSLPFIAALFFPNATPEQAAAMGPAMGAQMAALPREAFDAQQKASLANLTLETDYLPVIEGHAAASDQATVSKAFGELLAADLREDIAAIEAETVVLVPWAEAMPFSKDQVETFYAAQYAAMPNARLEIVSPSLHFIQIDQEAAFLEAVRAAAAE